MPKAVVVNRFGGPEVLELVDRPLPEPGPGQVRVRVKAAGIQPVDAYVRSGMAPRGMTLTFPITLGNEYAGVVEACAPDVADVSPGDEVLGFQPLTCQAEEAVVSASQLVPKPPEMPWEIAGSLSASGQTAHVAMEFLRVGAGDTLLLHAAAGGVGTMAVQLARKLGATVIGTASVRNHDHLRELGAIPVAYGDGLVERVRAIAPGGVTAVFDAAGGERTLLDSIELCPDVSRIGTIAAGEEAERLGVRRIVGPRTAERLAELVELWREGGLRVTVSRTFHLDEAVEAHRLVEARHLTGKLVFVND